MLIGAITSQIDIAQLVLYTFFGFFFLLILYLRREDKREGYPLNAERGGRVVVQGFPELPKPKAFHLHDGRTVLSPRQDRGHDRSDELTVISGGLPIEPITNNPMLSGVGPASFAYRADVPDTLWEGDAKIVPLRSDSRYSVAEQDRNPIGFPVVGRDNVVAGHVQDLWVDRNESQIRYIEVAVAGSARGVLVPRTLADIQSDRVRVWTVLSWQIGDAPRTKAAEQITLLEEDQIMAYFGSGNLYSSPERQEPFL